MKRVSRVTDQLLQGSQDLRNSDRKLLLAFWEREGLYLSEAQKVRFFGCTPAESITRARRTLRRKYPASKDIEAVRREREKEFAYRNSPKAIPWLDDPE